jgi:flagellar basal-body rod protein FlgC
MALRGIFSSIGISATGLTAQRKKMNAISENIANVNTTRTKEGGPYKRRISVFYEKLQKVGTVRLNDGTHAKSVTQATDPNHLKPFDSRFNTETFSTVGHQEIRDNSDPEMFYDPGHPDANEMGYVARPNINIISEMVDMIAATRSYEANVAAIDAAKSMAKRAMDI